MFGVGDVPGTVKPEIFATVLFSLISRVHKIRENKKYKALP